ncbi:hypothetical protein ATY75_00760 [Rhizobium sp. N122]|nr:hypothetical protein ATY75_00760 [Rhizobium sp. N122]
MLPCCEVIALQQTPQRLSLYPNDWVVLFKIVVTLEDFDRDGVALAPDIGKFRAGDDGLKLSTNIIGNRSRA